VVFVLIAGTGLAWNYVRPAVYRAVATVLTVKPKAVDTRSEEADLEHVTIQGRALMGDLMLEKVAAALGEEQPGTVLERDELRNLLSLIPVEETNLIELRAEGSDPVLLQSAVNAWAEAYEGLRQSQIAQLRAETMAELEDEQAALQLTIQERQEALGQFRERHDIVSLDSADNQAPAKLKGLNQSLNKARERLVEAEAARAAVMTAIGQGKTVVPKDQRAALTAKQIEAQKLRDRLASLNARYTRAYLDRDPLLKALPEMLAELEREVAGMQAIGQRQVVEETEQEVEAANASVRALKAQLRAHQSDAQGFTAVFSKHEVLQEEVAKLQDLSASNAERLAQIQARNLEKYPPVKVVDWAALPSRPIFPHYARDAVIVLGIALLTALFVTWLIEYLTGHRRQDPLPYTGVRVWPSGPPAQTALDVAPGSPALAHQGAEQLIAPTPTREMEQAEVLALLQAADPVTAGYIALLLSGVAPQELHLLEHEAFDLDAGWVLVPGEDARAIPLGRGALQRLEVCRKAIGEYLGGSDQEAVDSRLAVAAVDAGLPDAGSALARGLWYTYLVYLIRQGARLADLPQRVGSLPHTELRSLARYSPPGANRPLAEIDAVYPLLTDQTDHSP
jgi:uncharacterized protein involved in exopolysaccharide biosynthesis